MSENELIEAVQNFVDIVKDDVRISVEALPESDESFNGVIFWLHFCVECQKVARGASKLTLAYSLPPTPSPSDVSVLIAELVSSYSALVRCYLTLPKQRGIELAKAVTSYLTSIKSSLLHFLQLFVNALKESSGYPDLCSVGVLLDECKQVCKLPTDNKHAVISVIQNDNDFMIDTVDEITAEMKNQINLKRSGSQGVMSAEDDDENELWSDTEFTIVSHSLRLAKLGRTATETALKILKGDNWKPNTSENRMLAQETSSESKLELSEIKLLDELAQYSSQLSPQLDDLFAFIYPPVDTESLPPVVDKFVECLNNFITRIEKLPEQKAKEIELIQNIKVQLDKTSQQLKTLLVSNEIMNLADMNLG